MRVVAWFSCGAASAVAAKLAVEKYGDQAEVVYCDTMADEHPDNARFFEDVQRGNVPASVGLRGSSMSEADTEAAVERVITLVWDEGIDDPSEEHVAFVSPNAVREVVEQELEAAERRGYVRALDAGGG